MVEKDAVSKDFRKQVFSYGLTRSGKNHSFAVTIAHSKLIKPAELHAIDGMFRLH